MTNRRKDKIFAGLSLFDKDFLAIIDIDAMRGMCNFLTAEVVVNTLFSLALDTSDSCQFIGWNEVGTLHVGRVVPVHLDGIDMYEVVVADLVLVLGPDGLQDFERQHNGL